MNPSASSLELKALRETSVKVFNFCEGGLIQMSPDRTLYRPLRHKSHYKHRHRHFSRISQEDFAPQSRNILVNHFQHLLNQVMCIIENEELAEASKGPDASTARCRRCSIRRDAPTTFLYCSSNYRKEIYRKPSYFPVVFHTREGRNATRKVNPTNLILMINADRPSPLTGVD